MYLVCRLLVKSSEIKKTPEDAQSRASAVHQQLVQFSFISYSILVRRRSAGQRFLLCCWSLVLFFS